ncbi:MAG: TM2 domain-containing protein [Spirochaetia bacterium]
MVALTLTYKAWKSEIKEAFTGSGKWLLFTLLCSFLGVFGVHRFAAKRFGTGILYLLTFGIAGLGVVFDLSLLLMHKFKNNKGQFIFSSFTGFTRVIIFLLLICGIEYYFLFAQSNPYVPTNFIELYELIANTFNLNFMHQFLDYLGSLVEPFVRNFR